LDRHQKLLILAIVLLALLSVWQVNLVSGCEPPSPGTGTPGYWKNHPDAWPVETITIGGVTYTKEAAIAIMKTPGKGDKTITMFNALVAAKLNVEIENCSWCIYEVIFGEFGADWWMAVYGPVGSGVRANSEKWQASHGEALYEMLDAYNNGWLCAAGRD
jgi:hypothetical protein